MEYCILVINPGSTSTKIAVFQGEKVLLQQNIRHSGEELAPYAAITEEDAGLHFLLRLDGAPSDETLRREAEQRGIRLAMLSDYYQCPQDAPQHVLVVNYTGIDLDRLPAALERLAALWKENDHV